MDVNLTVVSQASSAGRGSYILSYRIVAQAGTTNAALAALEMTGIAPVLRSGEKSGCR